MSKFIVWDERFKKFIDNGCVRMNLENGNLHGKESFGNVEHWTAFNYIGKTDIDNNKIYADSSIVEFEYNFDEGWKKMIGYFHYDDVKLKYIIKAKEDGNKTLWNVDYEPSYFVGFKIIDTLQENKLKLFVESK